MEETSPLGKRRLRLALIDVALVLAATLWAPLWLLLLAPLLLGVPHVAADVRYLVLRPKLTAATVLAISIPLVAMTVLRVTALAGVPLSARVDVALGLAAVAGGVFSAGPRRHTRLVILLMLVAVVSLRWPQQALLALVHGHNAIALVVLVAWAGLGFVRGVALLGIVALAAALLSTGALSPWSWAPAAGVRLEDVARSLAPGFPEPVARALTLTFAFGQSLHFAAWLHLIPSVRNGPSLREDFGLPSLIPLGLLTVLIAFAALFDAKGVRSTYLTLVSFHAWLELAALAHLRCIRLSSG
jgi:hypothetical protein